MNFFLKFKSKKAFIFACITFFISLLILLSGHNVGILIFIYYPIINILKIIFSSKYLYMPNFYLPFFLIFIPIVNYFIVFSIQKIFKFIKNTKFINQNKIFLYFAYTIFIFDILNILLILEKNNMFNYNNIKYALIFSLAKFDYLLSQPFTFILSLFLNLNFYPTNYYYNDTNIYYFLNNKYYIYLLLYSPLWLRSFFFCNIIWSGLFLICYKIKNKNFYLFLEILIIIIFFVFISATISDFFDKGFYNFSASLPG